VLPSPAEHAPADGAGRGLVRTGRAAAADGPTAAEWETLRAAKLADPAPKKGLPLWFATGKDDFLLTTTRATVDFFKKHGFAPVFRETEGGHTWVNGRRCLAEFAPQLNQPSAPVPSARKWTLEPVSVAPSAGPPRWHPAWPR
jgi:enterochelin esterase family protein